MKKHLFNIFAAAALVLVLTGCPSTPIREDLTAVVPEAADAPSAFDNGAGGFEGQPGGAGEWGDPEKLAGRGAGQADADGWTPADPTGNNLGMPVIYFAYDSDVLVPSETANLDKIAAYLQKYAQLGLVIEGHCDSRGTDEYNRALGERRANAIRAYLAAQGVADNRMKTVSYGKDKPAVPGSGESIWRQNRRGVPIPMNMR